MSLPDIKPGEFYITKTMPRILVEVFRVVEQKRTTAKVVGRLWEPSQYSLPYLKHEESLFISMGAEAEWCRVDFDAYLNLTRARGIS